MSKFLRCLVFSVYAWVVLVAVGPVMRESDQASLIDGSIQIARDGVIFPRNYYNYSRQYGSYWLLALSYKVTGLDRPTKDWKPVVSLGNWVSSLVFLGGLGLLLSGLSNSSTLELFLRGAILMSPALLFSAPLLSSNLISAGFIFALVFALGRKSSKSKTAFAAILGFVAVATRVDAILVFPLIALLGNKEGTFRKLFRDQSIWGLGVASVVAILVGELVMTNPSSSYGTFFRPQVAVAYLSVGLGFSLLVLVSGALFCCWKGISSRNLYAILVALACVLPLLFYGRILFSPRHLVTSVITALLLLSLPLSRQWLRELRVSPKWSRLLIAFGAAVVVTPIFFGIRLNSLKSFTLVPNEPSLFPSADGYWPMGCYGQFYSWLRSASDTPLDHNQRLWGLWGGLEEFPDEARAFPSALVSFVMLKATLVDDRRVVVSPAEDWLVDSRSLQRFAIGVTGNVGLYPSVNQFKQEGYQCRILTEIGSEEIYQFTQEVSPVPEKIEVRRKLYQVGGGDDYILATTDFNWDSLRGGGMFRWFFFTQEGKPRELIASKEGFKKARSNEVWIARSALIHSFRAKLYEG